MGRKSYRPRKQKIKDALINAGGSFSKAAKMFKRPDGEDIPWSTFRDWVEYYQLEYIPELIRKTYTKMAVDVIIQKALEERDNACLFKIADRWGHLIGFGEPAQKQEIDHKFSMEKYWDTYDGKDLVKAREASERRKEQKKNDTI
ncbi:MAG: hypothetical protein ACFFG0_04265 [Candidatus Thorarchaeota archaeon]